jgi:chromosomal replication initiation ATPase DnaA
MTRLHPYSAGFDPKPLINLKTIIGKVAEIMEVHASAIPMRTRKREFVFARQMFCYIASKYTNNTTVQIGKFIGRDHATVIHSKKAFQNLIDTNFGSIANDYKKLLKNLKLRDHGNN